MQRYFPESLDQFLEYLVKVHENKKHIKMVKVESASSTLRITLDFAAHIGGYPDVYIPVKKSLVVQCKEIVAELLKESDAGIVPSRGLAERLMATLDSSGP